MKAFLKWCLVFIVSFLAGTSLFFLLMHIGFLSFINVLMYRGIAVLVLCGVLMVLVLAVLKKVKAVKSDIKDIFIYVLAFLCVNMVFFTLVPVTVERSVSVFMLSYMENHEAAFEDKNASASSKEDIEKVFNEKYVNEFGAFDKRFEEQITTGTIEKLGNGYVLTDRGRWMVSFFRLIGDIFDTDRRLLWTECEQ